MPLTPEREVDGSHTLDQCAAACLQVDLYGCTRSAGVAIEPVELLSSSSLSLGMKA